MTTSIEIENRIAELEKQLGQLAGREMLLLEKKSRVFDEICRLQEQIDDEERKRE